MSEKIVQVNIGEVIRSKAPGLYRWLPPFVITCLAKIITQDQINDFLRRAHGLEGVDFAKKLVDEQTLGVEVIGLEKLSKEGRYLFASNHPLGGFDGVALIASLGPYFEGKVKFVVNDLLMYLEPLRPVFLPINKHGGQSREAAELMNKEFESDTQILYFPAGLVSRRQENGRIEDLPWHKSFIAKSIQYRRDVVPVYFEATNSPFFYNFSFWRKRLGIKVNIDMIFLPRELFNKKDQRFRFVIGDPIPYTVFDSAKSNKEWAEEIRAKVYKLKTEL